jgi:hypothetical protein
MTLLYEKRGRRYVPAFDTESHESYSRDLMRVGTWRMTYAYADGSRRYEYDVTPDTASFRAAAMLAGEAMRQAINDAAVFRPSGIKDYTRKQREIIDRFTREMVAAGGLMPSRWIGATADQVARAGLEALDKWEGKQ